MSRSKIRSRLPVAMVILLAHVLISGASHAQPENDLCHNAHWSVMDRQPGGIGPRAGGRCSGFPADC